jgi:hypothetical protein
MAIRRHKVGCLADVVALRVVEICTLYQGPGLEQLSDRRGAEEGQAKLAALAISMRQILPCSTLYRHAVWSHTSLLLRIIPYACTSGRTLVDYGKL